MDSVIKLAKKASETDINVLIRGESGVGKELFARSIHNESDRSDNPFIAINCAAIPDTLLESELFGYEEGTFTGSKKLGKVGLFELANTGTIFLDEIGDMPYQLQSKILRVLESKTIRRLGGQQEVNLDIRILSATNQNLEERIDKKQFRLDLFYRLNAYTINIPPLRLRKEDIIILSNHFVKQYSNDLKKLAKPVISKLLNYEWKGNIRELEQCIQKSILLSNSGIIKEIEISASKSMIENSQEGSSFDFTRPYHESLELFEKLYFTFHAQKKLTTRALAKELEVSHATIANKLKKYIKNY
jgi:TyrR family helix-turn-helix protein